MLVLGIGCCTLHVVLYVAVASAVAVAGCSFDDMLCWGSATGGMCPLTNMGKKWMLLVNFYPFTFIFFLLAKCTVHLNTYLMA